MKDLIIIGAGPAGLSAAIYGLRAGLDLLLLEKLSPGGKVMNTSEIENYPGFVDPIEGWELMSAMEGQAKRLGVTIGSGEVKTIEKKSGDNTFVLPMTDGTNHETRTVIAATGSNLRTLDIPGEKDLTGKGVSYCGTCDGAFFKEKTIAVIGGGNSALEESIFLTRFSSKVYLIHRRDEFRGDKILQERIFANDAIEPIYNTIPVSINGEGKVVSLSVKNKKTDEVRDIELDGVFIYVGDTPNTGYLPAEVLNARGEVIVDMKMKSSVPGIYAAGDLRSESIRQIVTAAADGATAAMSAYDYIADLGG